MSSSSMKMDNFKKELKMLLDRYNACIDFGMDSCSDTHGISGEHMSISIKSNKGYEECVICHGYRIESNDIN
ncbi:hypothetical protein [uncultured Arcobacter sp.]|uniref:hypothetical protein n=1 Tax=uncultured Arcobacter sp. TaxID=165434 RepID=UPI002617C696|nr:hypothetical protein [uncultured Arcobacter sp.]